MKILLLITLLAIYETEGQRKEFCSLPSKQGNCRGFFIRFHFDPSTNDCKRFIYGGCNGNQNNFATSAGCRETCEVKVTPWPSSNNNESIETAPDVYDGGSEDTATESKATSSLPIAAPTSVITAAESGGAANVPGGSNASQPAEAGDVASSDIKENIVELSEAEEKPGREQGADKDAGDTENTHKDKGNSAINSHPDSVVLTPRNTTGSNGTEDGIGTGATVGSTSTIEEDGGLLLEDTEKLQTVAKNRTDISKNNTDIVSLTAEVGNVTINQGSQLVSGSSGAQLTNNSDISTNNSETTPVGSDSLTKNTTGNKDDSNDDFKPTIEEGKQTDSSSPEGGSNLKDTTNQDPPNHLATEHLVIPQPLSALASKPEVADPDCTSEPEKGYCRGLFQHYFYNSTSSACELFIYGGCEGNNNNYDSISSCQAACVLASNQAPVENEASESEAETPTTGSSLLSSIIMPSVVENEASAPSSPDSENASTSTSEEGGGSTPLETTHVDSTKEATKITNTTEHSPGAKTTLSTDLEIMPKS